MNTRTPPRAVGKTNVVTSHKFFFIFFLIFLADMTCKYLLLVKIKSSGK